MEIHTVQTIDLIFQDALTGEEERLTNLSIRLNRPVQDLLDDKAIQGILTYYVTYTDGSQQIIQQDKDEEVEGDTYKNLLLNYVKTWKTIYEWRSGQDFRTGLPLMMNIVGDRAPYGDIYDIDTSLWFFLEYDLLNTEQLIEDGYFFDPLLEKWIDIPESREGFKPLILDIIYLEGLKIKSRAIKQIDVTFQDFKTDSETPIAVCLDQYRKNKDSEERLDFFENPSIQGTLHVNVTYVDGSVQELSHDKSEMCTDWNMPLIRRFFEHWINIYEYHTKRFFHTNLPHRQYTSYYEYALETFGDEEWDIIGSKTREAIEARFGDGPYDEFSSAEEQFQILFDYGLDGVKAELEEGYYFDEFLNRWVDVEESFAAVRDAYNRFYGAE